jgi:hypothetical protein
MGKRKELEQVADGLSDFSLSGPDAKSRRLVSCLFNSALGRLNSIDVVSDLFSVSISFSYFLLTSIRLPSSIALSGTPYSLVNKLTKTSFLQIAYAVIEMLIAAANSLTECVAANSLTECVATSLKPTTESATTTLRQCKLAVIV